MGVLLFCAERVYDRAIMTSETTHPEGSGRRSVQRAVTAAEAYWGIEPSRVMGPGVRESSMGSRALFGDAVLAHPPDDEPVEGTRTVRYTSGENGWSVDFDAK